MPQTHTTKYTRSLALNLIQKFEKYTHLHELFPKSPRTFFSSDASVFAVLAKTEMPPRHGSAPASQVAARPPSAGIKMDKKPVRLSLFQTIRSTGAAKSTDRCKKATHAKAQAYTHKSPPSTLFLLASAHRKSERTCTQTRNTLYLSLCLSHPLSLSRKFSTALFLSFSLSLVLSLKHTHTHTYTHTRTHIYKHTHAHKHANT